VSLIFILFPIAFAAGCLGSILGVGGGLIITPVLTLGFGLPIRYAIGASMITILATSSAAAVAYVRDRVTNIRLAILLEIATSLGGVCGALLNSVVNPKYLYLLFAFVLGHSAYQMGRHRETVKDSSGEGHPLAKKLSLNSQFIDPSMNQTVSYTVHQVPFGFFVMLWAGILSGLLGIGSGILKVLAMDRAMKLPIKVSSATSNFMIGVTASAGATAYFIRGDVVPEIAAPVALGVLGGATLGSKLMLYLPAQTIRRLFVIVLLIISVQMAIKGFTSGQ